MNINEEYNKWVIANPNKTIEEAFMAGFIFHSTMLDAINQKKEEKIKAKQDLFYKSLIPYVVVYGKDIIREFYDYWSEGDMKTGKLRWEKAAVVSWQLDRRLNRWSNNQKDTFKGPGQKEKEPESKKYKEYN